MTGSQFILCVVLVSASCFAQPPCFRSSKPDFLGIPRWAWGTGKLPPRVTSRPDPEYDEESKKLNVQGTVLLSVELDDYGKIKGVTPLKSFGRSLSQPDKCPVREGCPLPEGMVRKAIENVKRWEFEPACKNEHGIPTTVTVEVNFRLY